MFSVVVIALPLPQADAATLLFFQPLLCESKKTFSEQSNFPLYFGIRS